MRKSGPNQNNRPFVAGFRMIRDILSDNLHELLPLNRLLGCAKSPRLELQVVNHRHGLEDPINVAQALDNSLGFERV